MSLSKTLCPLFNTSSIQEDRKSFQHNLIFCPRPFGRKAEGLSFCLSVLPSIRSSVLPTPFRSRYLVGATPTALYRFFWNFTGVLVMVLRYACGLDISLRLFFVTFSQVELSHFSGIIDNNVNGQGIPCGHNSSYSFIPILSKLHWCFGHGLKICMWLRYNPQIYFIMSLFLQVELTCSHISSIIYNKVNGQGIPCGRNSS